MRRTDRPGEPEIPSHCPLPNPRFMYLYNIFLSRPSDETERGGNTALHI